MKAKKKSPPKMKKSTPEEVRAALDKIAPSLKPFLYQHKPEDWDLLPITGRTVANYCSAGKGPEGKVIIHGRVAYERDALLCWLTKLQAGDPKVA